MYQIRLANIVGLDIANAQHSVAIDEALIGIEDREAFLEYCRDNKEGIEYATKPERLDTLATKYKKMQASAKLPHGLSASFSHTICKKISMSRAFLKNEIEAGNDKPFSRLRQNGESYFTQKELNALAELKISPASIIELFESDTLQAALIALFMSKLTAKRKYDYLAQNQAQRKVLLKAKEILNGTTHN